MKIELKTRIMNLLSLSDSPLEGGFTKYDRVGTLPSRSVLYSGFGNHFCCSIPDRRELLEKDAKVFYLISMQLVPTCGNVSI